MKCVRWMFLVLLMAAPLAGQELPAGDPRNVAFRALMNQIVADNGGVKDFMRMPVGTEYNLPDGTRDRLEDGDDHGIWGREFVKLYGTPYSTFLETKTVTTSAPEVHKPISVESVPIEIAETMPWYQTALLPWLALAATVVVLTYIIARLSRDRAVEERETRERELVQDPVTSGPPIVAGGVQANEADRLSRTLEAAAVADYVRLNPGVDRQTVRVERIGPVEEGMISGEGMVGYADRARPRRIDPPQAGFRARFRFPDGREDLLMSLQGCMNPCFYGEGLSGFTFTARQVAVPAPEPPQPGPEPAPHPALAVRAIRTGAEAEGRSTLTIGDRVIVLDRGVHLSVDEATGKILVSGAAFEMAVTPKRVRNSRRLPGAKTGTE
jgi:hypothetical protein